MYRNVFLVVLFFTIFLSNSLAQKRILIQGVDVIEGKRKFSIFPKNSGTNEALKVVPPFCINFFANNKKFVVIDRQNLSLLNAEKELQKSEDFIDGYIVEQGKSEGADYALKGLYLENEKNLNLRIYDITTESVLCQKDQALETNIFGIKNFENIIHSMLHEMLYDCFGIKFSVVRPLEEKKDEAKKILVAVGKKHKASKSDRVEVFYMVEETIDDEVLERASVIGEGEIDEIQDENFSTIKVKKGGKEISTALKDNKKLYCLIKNQY